MVEGALRIDLEIDHNRIQLFNAPNVCSLVINDKIVGEYRGFVATRFNLRSEIVTNEKTIVVEAKMGFLYMRIFYDGKCVAKKFMGFG